MNFEDEPYVRVYTRKTLTHKLLGWEGRAVMRLMIDEFDPAGVFEIRGDAAQCISAVTDIPLEIVQVGLRRLIETETWIVTGRAITWPTYEEAQNCMRSDRLRQRASRKARAAKSVTDVTLAVTRDRATVTELTPRHEMSPSLPPIPPPSLPSTQERETLAPPVPEVPGLEIVAPAPVYIGLQPSQRDRAAALPPPLPPSKYEYDPDFWPTKANQARGLELGLTEKEIWERWDLAKDKPYPRPFRDCERQFNRELAFAAQDKTTKTFKTRAERDAFEMPGKERRA